MTSILEQYAPPALVAGIVRGLYWAAISGLGISVTNYLATGDTGKSVALGLLSALGALGVRTGEGALDARRDERELREFQEPAPEVPDVNGRILTDREVAIIEGIRGGTIEWRHVAPSTGERV